MARVGSFINGPVVTSIAEPKPGQPETDVHVGLALLVGFAICVFSLVMAFLLAFIDLWAEKKDGIKVELSEDEKFKMRDLKDFCTKERLPYWLVTGSCVSIYMVVFIYISNSTTMLIDLYGFGSLAGTIYGVPYIISGVLSPILGFVIDKVGKRALFSKFYFLLITSFLYISRQFTNP